MIIFSHDLPDNLMQSYFDICHVPRWSVRIVSLLKKPIVITEAVRSPFAFIELVYSIC